MTSQSLFALNDNECSEGLALRNKGQDDGRIVIHGSENRMTLADVTNKGGLACPNHLFCNGAVVGSTRSSRRHAGGAIHRRRDNLGTFSANSLDITASSHA